MSISEIKTKGRTAFKANYWRCVVAAILLVLLVGGTAASGTGNAQNTVNELTPEQQSLVDTINNMPEDMTRTMAAALVSAVAAVTVIGIVLRIFVFNPLKVGCYRFFLKNADDASTSLGVIKEGFGGYGHVFATLFLTDLFTFLWSLLLVIPGIIAAYSYRLVPYIIKDHPELSAMEVIRKSKELMKGNKWKAFLLDLSFIGWFLLGAITLGLVNVFWTNPYSESANAVFYNDLKG